MQGLGSTLSGVVGPAPSVMDAAAMGKSPFAEMRTIEAPGCVYFGFTRSNCTCERVRGFALNNMGGWGECCVLSAGC